MSLVKHEKLSPCCRIQLDRANFTESDLAAYQVRNHDTKLSKDFHKHKLLTCSKFWRSGVLVLLVCMFKWFKDSRFKSLIDNTVVYTGYSVPKCSFKVYHCRDLRLLRLVFAETAMKLQFHRTQSDYEKYLKPKQIIRWQFDGCSSREAECHTHLFF